MGEDRAGVGWSEVAARFLDLAKSNPLFWVGAVFVALAFVESANTSGLDTRSPRAALVIGGFVLLACGAVPMFFSARRQAKDRFADPALYDASFWHEVFDALPPTFIKACSVDDQGALEVDLKHVAENEAFISLQGKYEAGDVADEARMVIKADHHRGDEQAFRASGSRMLESHDTYGMHAERQILTFKKKVEYGDETFIVGWYVPVELPDDLSPTTKQEVRELARQLVFGLVAPKGDDDVGQVWIGESARRAAARGKRSG